MRWRLVFESISEIQGKRMNLIASETKLTLKDHCVIVFHRAAGIVNHHLPLNKLKAHPGAKQINFYKNNSLRGTDT